MFDIKILLLSNFKYNNALQYNAYRLRSQIHIQRNICWLNFKHDMLYERHMKTLDFNP